MSVDSESETHRDEKKQCDRKNWAGADVDGSKVLGVVLGGALPCLAQHVSICDPILEVCYPRQVLVRSGK